MSMYDVANYCHFICASENDEINFLHSNYEDWECYLGTW